MIKQYFKQSGFTLVEISAVMVIIGLILGAISIGNNLNQTAERQKLFQFIQDWAEAYNEYYARTGVVVGDNLLSPSLYINNVTVTDFNNDPLDALKCEGGGIKSGGFKTNANEHQINLFATFDEVGIAMPLGKGEGYEDRFTYEDSNGNLMDVIICFRAVSWLEADGQLRLRNVMQISGLNPDVARMLDSMIDGHPDAGTGSFHEGTLGFEDQVVTPPHLNNRPWSTDNTAVFGTIGDGDNQTLDGDNLDEDQVTTVVAFYRMNQ